MTQSHFTGSRSSASSCAPPPASDIDLASQAPAFLRAIEKIERYARRDEPILLEGETGTGKSLLARHVHARSTRAASPFETLALSASDDALAASEFFGHLDGAFTDAKRHRAGRILSANHGTLFLDEIGKASRQIQQKLLLVVQDGVFWPVGGDRMMRVDVRIVAATNTPLAQLVGEDRFLDDLNARLKTFRVCLPALRERREDIPGLINRAIARHAPSAGYLEDAYPAVDDHLMASLIAYEWPHNLRELDGVMRRLLADAQLASVLTIDHIASELDDLSAAARSCLGPLTTDLIQRTVAETGSIQGAAKRLGIARTTVQRHLKRARA